MRDPRERLKICRRSRLATAEKPPPSAQEPIRFYLSAPSLPGFRHLNGTTACFATVNDDEVDLTRHCRGLSLASRVLISLCDRGPSLRGGPFGDLRNDRLLLLGSAVDARRREKDARTQDLSRSRGMQMGGEKLENRRGRRYLLVVD